MNKKKASPPKKRPSSRPKPKRSSSKGGGKTWLLVLIVLGMVSLVILGLFTGQKGHMGIDVSHWQADIDWAEVAAEGDVEYCFIKATEGKARTDDSYEKNLEGARRQGILAGAYHFFSSKESGEEQFRHFVKVVGKDIDLKPVLDLEEKGGKIVNEDKYKTEVSDFISLCVEYYHCYPIIYASPSFVKDHHLKETIRDCTYWMAWYTQMPLSVVSRRHFLLMTHPGTQAIMWQYTETGTHRGINGNVDLNECWEMPALKL